MKLFQEDFGKTVVKLSVKSKLWEQYNEENRLAAAKKKIIEKFLEPM